MGAYSYCIIYILRPIYIKPILGRVVDHSFYKCNLVEKQCDLK